MCIRDRCTTVQEENGYKVGDDVMVDLPTGTIEGTIGYIGETDVRIDTSAHGQSWDNEVINKRQFEDGLRQNEPSQRVDEMCIRDRCKPAAGRFPTPREVEDQYGRP